MEEFYWVVAIAVLTVVIYVYSEMGRKQRLRFRIRDKYGNVPKKDERELKPITIYWEENKDVYDDKIDEVTWNDLGFTSLFHRINICCSFVGEQILYAMLHRFPSNKEYGERLEKKINYFADNPKERFQVQLILSGLGKQDSSYHVPTIIKNLDLFKLDNMNLYRIMQILLPLSLLPAIILRDKRFLGFTVIVFLINTVLYARKKMEYEIFLSAFGSLINVINTAKVLAEKKDMMHQMGAEEIGKLAKPFSKISRSMNMMQSRKVNYSGDVLASLMEYIMGATLLEFTSYDRMLKELKGNEENYMRVYEAVGQLDMAISIASFRETLPYYCIPEFSKKHAIRMKGVYHPLTSNPVGNDVTLDNNCIITGSNASGKSTFIKAVAVNVLLGQSIHTCMAVHMEYPFAKVITSMAVTDDLMAGESYFIKEIKYLKRIVTSLSKDQFVVCVIDEILRGTNTEERIAASAAILEYLSDKNCLSIVASHDIELTKLLEGTYDNYHFCEKIIENDIMFDYKIHNGPSNTKNAIRLLEYIGFPEKIVSDAKRGCLHN